MPTTPTYALPYPAGGDDIRLGNDVIQALAERVEALLSVQTGNRNVLRNGDMSVWQKGTVFNPLGGLAFQTTADGWKATHSGGTASVSQVAIPPGQSPGTFLLSANNAGAAAAGDYWHLSQRIENVRTLAGRQVTLSLRAYANTGTPKIGVQLEQVFGTGGSTSVVTPVGSITLSATPTYYSLTFTVPSVTGKTITGGNDYLGVLLWLSGGSTYVSQSSGIGIQNGTVNISDVQLEAGDKATPFERLSYHAQLAWCQRYFYRVNNTGGGNLYVGTGNPWNAANLYTPFVLPVPPRAVPTFSTSAALGYLSTGNATVTSSGMVGLAGFNTVTITAVGTFTAGAATLLFVPPGVYMDFAMEL